MTGTPLCSQTLTWPESGPGEVGFQGTACTLRFGGGDLGRVALQLEDVNRWSQSASTCPCRARQQSQQVMGASCALASGQPCPVVCREAGVLQASASYAKLYEAA